MQENDSKKCEDFEVRFCCPKNSLTSTQVPTTDSIKDSFSIDVYKKLIRSTLPKDNSTLRKLYSKLLFLSRISLFNSVKRFNICLPSSIGLHCESGDVSDCNLSLSMEVLPYNCKGKLIFSSNSERDCGSKCDFNTKRSIPLRKGWTKYDRYIINRIDRP